MQLPNLTEAFVPGAKIAGYLLSLDHRSGRDKARFFTRLGFRPSLPGQLQRSLLQHAGRNEVSSVVQTAFGTKYLIEGRIEGPTGDSAEIRSIWFVEAGESQPRFVTAYPMRGVKDDVHS